MESRIPPQHQHTQPGLEAKMSPEPKYIRYLYKGAEKLKGKVALITGGDSGIGRAVAIHFAREGADVAIVYTPEEQTDAQRTKDLVEAEGQDCLLLSGNLRDEAFCQQVVDDTIREYGQLNILVNNAAVQYVHSQFEQIRDEDYTAPLKPDHFVE